MESRVTGGLLGLFFVSLGACLLTAVTMGLGLPWAAAMKARWVASHTVLDGRQLYFDGTGGQLFGNYIKWFLLTLVTLGIYSFWLNIKMRQWITKHTHMR